MDHIAGQLVCVWHECEIYTVGEQQFVVHARPDGEVSVWRVSAWALQKFYNDFEIVTDGGERLGVLTLHSFFEIFLHLKKTRPHMIPDSLLADAAALVGRLTNSVNVN